MSESCKKNFCFPEAWKNISIWLFDLPRHCANNYKGKYGTKLCATCKTIDDENNRINHCIRWKDVNLYSDEYEIDSEDSDVDDINFVDSKTMTHAIIEQETAFSCHGDKNILMCHQF